MFHIFHVLLPVPAFAQPGGSLLTPVTSGGRLMEPPIAAPGMPKASNQQHCSLEHEHAALKLPHRFIALLLPHLPALCSADGRAARAS